MQKVEPRVLKCSYGSFTFRDNSLQHSSTAFKKVKQPHICKLYQSYWLIVIVTYLCHPVIAIPRMFSNLDLILSITPNHVRWLSTWYMTLVAYTQAPVAPLKALATQMLGKTLQRRSQMSEIWKPEIKNILFRIIKTKYSLLNISTLYCLKWQSTINHLIKGSWFT